MGRRLTGRRLAIATGQTDLPKSVVMERRKFWRSQGFDLPPNPYRRKPKPKTPKPKPPKAAVPTVKECLIVGKGPSAVNTLSHMTGCPVVSINDAMKLFPGPVAYCFFSERRLSEATRPFWDRVERFVCPDIDEIMPDGIPMEKVTRYPWTTKVTRKNLRQLVRERKVTHWGSATAAMSFLAYEGFKKLRMIGFDGGTGLAPGVTRGMPEGFDYAGFLHGQKELAKVLTKEMGVTIEWLK